MNKKILIVSLFLIVGILGFKLSSNKPENLVNPQMSPPFETSFATPNAPKTFQFDSTTDLKMELDKVNPQVLDSDF